MSQLENARRRDPKNNTAAASSEIPFHLQLPALDDAASIQRAISLVVHALATGALEASRARTLLYGLQIAASNARRLLAKNESELQPATEAQVAATTFRASEMEEDVLTLHTAKECNIEESGIEGSTADAAAQPEESLSEAESESGTTGTPSSSIHTADLSEMYIAPSCSSRANSYKGNARDRLLAFRQKGLVAPRVTHELPHEV